MSLELRGVLFVADLLQSSSPRVDHERYDRSVAVVANAVPLALGDEHRVALAEAHRPPSERARQAPSSTYMICSAFGCRCNRCALPGGSSEESKMIPRAPAMSLLMMFLTIKPSWSGLVITCPATSRPFLISTLRLSSAIR